MTGALLALRLSRPYRPAAFWHRRTLSPVGRPRRRVAGGRSRWPTRNSWSSPISTARARTRASSSPHRSPPTRSRSSTPTASWPSRSWNGDPRGAVLARQRRRLGALLLEDKPLNKPEADKVKAAMLDGIAPARAGRLAVERRASRAGASASPSCADARRELAGPLRPGLLASLAEWLGPFLDGMSRRDHLSRVDLSAALKTLVPWDQQRQLDRLAPTHIEVPSGSRIPVDYGNPAEPTLSVRLQEMFGLTDTPRVGGGKVPVLIHLLSPARRPVQVTRDLASFWASGYQGGEGRAQGPLPEALLARRPAGRRTDGPGAAAALAILSLPRLRGRGRSSTPPQSRGSAPGAPPTRDQEGHEKRCAQRQGKSVQAGG